MTISVPPVQAAPADLEEAFIQIRQAALLLAVDHARAGGNFFSRLFDRHPEVLTLPYVSYLYQNLIERAAGRSTLPGKKAFEHLAATNVSLLVNDPTPETRRQLLRLGNNPEAPLDREVARRVLQALVRDREAVNPSDVVRAVYLAYALATGRSIRSVRYLLLTESVEGSNGSFLEAAQRESPPARVIHLVRDPRANFASFRHQYVNQWQSMYPLERFLRGENGFLWLWVLQTTARGARTLRSWKAGADPARVFTLRNEDLNLRFQPTLERLTRWLDVGWFDPWSSPDYVPTSNGLPWQGMSAFSTAYQPFARGPLPNDPPGQDRFFKPNREVTERWKKRVLPREIPFLEAIYEREMRELEYPFMTLGRSQSRPRALLNVLLPFSGELPPFRWYTRFVSWRDLLRKLSYPFVLPFAYVLSRLQFALLHARGEFR